MIRGLCIDVAGVLTQGDCALPGAIDALKRLQAAGLPFRLLTNTSRTPPNLLLHSLQEQGFSVKGPELITAPDAIRHQVIESQLTPWYLVHPDIESLFPATPRGAHYDTVVVCDAGEAFDYARLNQAFSLLLQGARFLAIGRNRYFRDAHGLQLDAGPFIEALHFASGRDPEWIGKPGPALFQAASQSMSLPLEDLLMIGDDVGSDVLGAQALGMPSILVKTGKYQAGDETSRPDNAQTLADFPAAVDALLKGLLKVN